MGKPDAKRRRALRLTGNVRAAVHHYRDALDGRRSTAEDIKRAARDLWRALDSANEARKAAGMSMLTGPSDMPARPEGDSHARSESRSEALRACDKAGCNAMGLTDRVLCPQGDDFAELVLSGATMNADPRYMRSLLTEAKRHAVLVDEFPALRKLGKQDPNAR